MDRITVLGMFLALLIAWSPGGIVDRGRQAAAPIQPFRILTR